VQVCAIVRGRRNATARNAGGNDGVADGVAPAAAPLGSAQVTGDARAGASAVGGTCGQHDRRLAPAPGTQPATLEAQAPASWRGWARGSSRRAQCGVVRRLQGPFPHPRRGAPRSADHQRRVQPLPDRLSPSGAVHRGGGARALPARVRGARNAGSDPYRQRGPVCRFRGGGTEPVGSGMGEGGNHPGAQPPRPSAGQWTA
jgi:hypothetical protein